MPLEYRADVPFESDLRTNGNEVVSDSVTSPIEATITETLGFHGEAVAHINC